MKIVESFPNAVREIEHAWVPMPDGCRLSARLWLPEGAEREPVPAVLEYIPYRKRAGTRWRDEPIHRYFAGHGYAAVRVDVRGSGESEGFLEDEYSEAELADGEALIAWLAAQPWCSGRVGLIGKSWGGINALQLAARRPPALGAVISVCGSDDRWTTDAHYMGGCLLNENLKWGSALLTVAALPPDPELVPEWREVWLERLLRLPLYPELWMRHPSRDAYWRRDSVLEAYGRIECPVFAVGGWADAYTDTVFRLLAGLPGPRRGLVGPWAHLYPHDGQPGPAIGFLQEACRWWERWLGGVRNGIEDEPALVVWIGEVGPPAPAGEAPGRWVSEASWPSRGIAPRRFELSDAGLEPGSRRAPAGVRDVLSPVWVGGAAGAWCPFGSDELPDDQREDDAASVVFDSPPLEAPLEVLGAPVAELELATMGGPAQLAVRLVDVAPDGSARRVSYGLLDLAHRHGSEAPRLLAPDTRERIRVELRAAGHAFAAGHRLRLALSTSYWPIAWPSGGADPIRVFSGGSALWVPERTRRADEAPVGFAEAESAPEPVHRELSVERHTRQATRDEATGRTETRVLSGVGPDGEVALIHYEAIGLELGHVIEERYRIGPGPGSARAQLEHRRLLRRGEWSVRVETRCRLSIGREGFRLIAALDAWEGGERVATRRWRRRVPRGATPRPPRRAR
jgi:hypothetical protein